MIEGLLILSAIAVIGGVTIFGYRPKPKQSTDTGSKEFENTVERVLQGFKTANDLREGLGENINNLTTKYNSNVIQFKAINEKIVNLAKNKVIEELKLTTRTRNLLKAEIDSYLVIINNLKALSEKGQEIIQTWDYLSHRCSSTTDVEIGGKELLNDIEKAEQDIESFRVEIEQKSAIPPITIKNEDSDSFAMSLLLKYEKDDNEEEITNNLTNTGGE